MLCYKSHLCYHTDNFGDDEFPIMTTTDSAAIVADNLGKTVSLGSSNLTILDNINLTIHRGESLAIVGTSGSGKSTLLGLLAGLDSPSTGKVTLENKPLSTMSEDERAKVRAEHVGFVFQAFQLLPNLTALENVMLPLEVLGRKEAEQSAREMLETVGLGERYQHYPKQLSGGEQQRVALARAFVTRPDILFADEPTGNLDSRTGAHIENLLFELNQKNQTTLVLVTHDSKLAERCDRTVHLEGGVLEGTA